MTAQPPPAPHARQVPQVPQAPQASPGPHRGRRVGGPAAHLLDWAITVAAARAAAPGGIRFTERQLYYATCRVLRPVPNVLRRIPRSPAPSLRLAHFTRALEARGGEVPGLLREFVAEGTSPAVGPAREPDVYDYGLPRLLICQDRSIARMLLANHVHLEAACPILAAEDGQPLDARLVAGLERAQGATVYVLHDASPTGLALPGRIRDGFGPVPGVRVASLGLVPRHAASLHLASGRAPGPVPLREPLPKGLRPQEVAWLAQGRFTQVAAVPPEQLLRTVQRLTRGPRPLRPSVWTDLRELRSTGFLTWPTAQRAPALPTTLSTSRLPTAHTKDRRK
ncbi:hypothetical protein [Streptomyces zagrosensis]|uniref:Uncharacterized protein n=1 Tax=Streptomyces zagrosensis TaxID=1042984 RepID=A0A7W9QGU5_9ACTN|nr:hypothetical protein [Streptomyces zagrosensis]MBB5939724.1 hypothetical protein [Streptomyces zagrosensis]